MSGGPSPFKGVCWHRAANRWMVAISVDGKRSTLGYFENEEDAARKYDEAAAPLGRPLNFPDDGQFEAVKGGGGGTSNYKGVSLWRQRQWFAQISIDGKKFGLGYYATEEEAARKYDEHAGPLGRPLNLPEGLVFFSAVEEKKKRASSKIEGLIHEFSLACDAPSCDGDDDDEPSSKRLFKGVRLKPCGTWAATISVGKKTINLGTFNNEEGAARRYDEAAAPLGRSLNFPADPSESPGKPSRKRKSRAQGLKGNATATEESASPPKRATPKGGAKNPKKGALV